MQSSLTVPLPRWTRYIPYPPSPKQALFLSPWYDKYLELLYGGAAGGGKSIGLLMGGLQYVDVPGFAAIILRKSFSEFFLPEGLITQSMEWLGKTDAYWNGNEHCWHFPSGSMLQFGYIGMEVNQSIPRSRHRYKGAAFQYVAWDELTENLEAYYLFMFSRLRRPACPCQHCDKPLYTPDRGVTWLHRPTGEVGLCLRPEPKPEILERYPPAADGMSIWDVPLRVRAGSNPGGPGHPLDAGEVLTPNGWRDIWTMQVGDAVYAVNPQGELVASIVAQRHVQNSPVLVDVRARGLRMRCTPEHRVAKVGGTRETRAYAGGRAGIRLSWTIVPFHDLPGQATILRTVSWRGRVLRDVHPASVTTGRRRLVQPTWLRAVDYCELLGWMLSEGSVVQRDRMFAIAQMKPRGRQAIRVLLDRLGFSAREGPTGFFVTSPEWSEHFAVLGRSRQKAIPAWIKEGSPEYLRPLLTSLMAGDGHWIRQGVSGEYYTISRQLADDVAEIAFKLGYVVYVSSRQRTNRRGLSYCVSIKRVRSGGTEILTGHHCYRVSTQMNRRSDVRYEEWNRPTICLGVPVHHALVVRQEGSVWVSGNSWVRRRWQIKKAASGQFVGHNPEAPFIPAYVRDNPALDEKSYTESLDRMDPITRAQYLKGDWTATKEGRFKRRDARYYTTDTYGAPHPVAFLMMKDEPKTGERVVKYHAPFRECRWFVTVDPAGSVREGPADEEIWRRDPSWTVISVWAVTPQADLCWVDCYRAHCEIPDILTAMKRIQRQYLPEFIGIEGNGLGIGVVQHAQRAGLPVRDLKYLGHATSDKLAKATDATIRMANGKIYFPEEAPWLEDLFDELFSWTGHPQTTCDQIDTLSYAAMIVSREAGEGEFGWFGRDGIPFVDDGRRVPQLIS